jgi:hypothetical protein
MATPRQNQIPPNKKKTQPMKKLLLTVFVVILLVFLLGLMVFYMGSRVQTRVLTRAKHNVTVTRKTREGDLIGYKTWEMGVASLGIEFSRVTSHGVYSVKFPGTDGKNALSVFNTFSQWTATARANHVEPFSKRISSDCTFSRYHLGGSLIEIPCEFSYNGSGATLNEEFEVGETDIAKFSELLKQLPEANAERLAKESKAEQEQSLFK